MSFLNESTEYPSHGSDYRKALAAQPALSIIPAACQDLSMASDEESAERATAEYRRLRDECETMQNSLRAIGRIDVPLDSPAHITNADPATRRRWFQQYRDLVLKEMERERARKWATTLQRRQLGASGSPVDLID